MIKNQVGGIPMKRDDFHVIQYQILNYLYEKIKLGNDVNEKELQGILPTYNEKYLNYIIHCMESYRLIEGIKVVGSGKLYEVTNFNKCYITPIGIEYLFKEPLMKEVKEYFDGIKEWEN